jgi:DNA repair photolyase
MMVPVIPGLTDHEMPAIFAAAAEAGACDAGIVPLRLPGAVSSLFEGWLERHMPGMKDKVLGRIRDMRGGKLNDPRFGSRMRGEGIFAEQIRSLYEVSRKKAGFSGVRTPLSTASFRVPSDQMMLDL